MNAVEKREFLKKVIASPVVPRKDKMKARTALSKIEFELALKKVTRAYGPFAIEGEVEVPRRHMA